MYTVFSGASTLTSHCTLCGIRRHAQSTQVTRELRPPVPQGRLLDVEPHALLAYGLEDQMHMRMWLVRVQHHRVPMLPIEFLAREVAHR
jgi:hypothetical protein